MKILLVDDNATRLPRIISFLTQKVGVSRDDIESASTGAEARRALATQRYDLLVLDVLLQQHPESEPALETSVGLMMEIIETGTLRKPAHIIGLTAYEDAEAEAKIVFQQQAWTVLRSSDVSDEWLEPLAQSVRYIRERAAERPSRKDRTDLLIVTALRLEMDAVKRAWHWDAEGPLDDTTFIAKGRFLSGGEERTVVASVAPRMGMVSSCHLASKLIERFSPRVVLMPGICAGVKGRARLGDVVLAEMAWDYQSGKHVLDSDSLSGFQIDPHFVQVDASIAAKWKALCEDDTFAQSVWTAWPIKYPQPPSGLVGPMASGSAVIANSSVTDSILKQQRKTLAVEMEAYGIYFASSVAESPRPLFCAIKSVCDFADEHKNDNDQHYAAYTSASFARGFFERFMVDFAR